MLIFLSNITKLHHISYTLYLVTLCFTTNYTIMFTNIAFYLCMGVTLLENIIDSDLANDYKLLLKIFDAIPDVIKVYKIDRTIIFFNEAACNFYERNPEEVYGKRCCQILDDKKYCDDCQFNKVIKTRKPISIERYYPKANKYMNVCYTPVLDNVGKITYIVERMVDITEKKTSTNLLRKDEKMYREIINAYPDGIMILQDNEIVLANSEINNLLQLSRYKTTEKSVFRYLPEKLRKIMSKVIRNTLKNKDSKVIREYSYLNEKGEKINLQFSLNYILYNGKEAVLAIIRDITELNKSLSMATEIQVSALQKVFPLCEKAAFEYIYYPANTVSGDYFKMYKISNELVVGVLIDVSGNGITAALNISAFDVLFLQEILENQSPLKILNELNLKYNKYNTNFIAACCFSIDFKNKQATVVGAGINEFLLKKSDCSISRMEVRGPFLGMFENSQFDEKTIKFESGDTFYFFTDGLDFVFDEDRIIQKYMEKAAIGEVKDYINNYLDDVMAENGKIKDDSSMLAIEIK